jgi:hypothetical protein
MTCVFVLSLPIDRTTLVDVHATPGHPWTRPRSCSRLDVLAVRTLRTWEPSPVTA